MTTIQDIEARPFVHISISTWSAAASIKDGDLPNNVLDGIGGDFASSGRKYLYDRKKLTAFANIKNKVSLACRTYGEEFFGGWLVHEDALSELLDRLEKFHSEWTSAYHNLLSSYDENCRQWLEQVPAVLRNAVEREMPCVDQIVRKYKFSWQVAKFTFTPTNTSGDDTTDVIAELGDQVIDGMAERVRGLLGKNGSVPTKAALAKFAKTCRIRAYATPSAAIMADIADSLVNLNNDFLTKTVLEKLSYPIHILDACSNASANAASIISDINAEAFTTQVEQDVPNVEQSVPNVEQSIVAQDVDVLLNEAAKVVEKKPDSLTDAILDSCGLW